MLPPASSKRSKNSRSRGAKTWDSRATRRNVAREHDVKARGRREACGSAAAEREGARTAAHATGPGSAPRPGPPRGPSAERRGAGAAAAGVWPALDARPACLGGVQPRRGGEVTRVLRLGVGGYWLAGPGASGRRRGLGRFERPIDVECDPEAAFPVPAPTGAWPCRRSWATPRSASPMRPSTPTAVALRHARWSSSMSASPRFTASAAPAGGATGPEAGRLSGRDGPDGPDGRAAKRLSRRAAP
jgi:hypothetical protein